jgi:hypothetical protein
MFFETNLALGIISAVLSVILVYLFFRVYWSQRSLYLLGMPIGFLFLAISNFFLVLHFFYPNTIIFSTSLMWIRVITQTWGFILIASSYYLSRKREKTTKFGLIDLSAWSVVSVICIFGLLVLLNPAMILATVYVSNGFFSIVNLALLSYIFIFLLRNLDSAKNLAKGMVATPLVFALLWLGQLCFLIWDIDKSQVALLGSQASRAAGLGIFIWIYYLVSKESKTGEEEP